MLTQDGARLQVVLELRELNGARSGPEELVILDEHTIERAWGWVFFYTTRGWRDGDFRYAVAGNGPIIVSRADGELRHTGTGHSVEHYLAEYEAELERRQGAWELFIQQPTDISAKVVSRIRKALDLSVTEATALRKKLPCVCRVGARQDLEPLLTRLTAAGVPAQLRQAVCPLKE